jgi:hypothetical protein
MSNLNNFMKNNKGYYSWIHSLKQAAMQSHTKGAEMLSEARKRVEQGMDLDAKAAIDAEIRARGERRALSAKELAAAGDANDVAAEAQEDEDGDHIPNLADPDSVNTNFNVPMEPTTRVHPEQWYKTKEEAEEAARVMGAHYRGETAPEEEDFVPPHEEKPAAAGGAWSKPATFKESVNKKIKKIISEMRGEEPVRDLPVMGERGTLKTGQSGESAGLLGQRLPTDLLNNINPTQRNPQGIIRHLIQVVENPQEHPPHHFKIANEILSTMGDVYKRGR